MYVHVFVGCQIFDGTEKLHGTRNDIHNLLKLLPYNYAFILCVGCYIV